MKKILMGLAVAAFLVPVSTFAAYMNGGSTVVINPSQTINDNAYVAGGTVLASGVINGDLLVAGGTINLSGKVANDLMIGGGTIIINNVSAQDARIVGGNITIGGTYSGEVVAAGGQVTVTTDMHAVKDSHIAGGSVMFNGNEAGNLVLAGGTVYVNGTVGKDVTIKSSKQVTIGSGAVIKGNLEYSAPVAATIEAGAQINGTTTFHQVAVPAKNNAWAGSLGALLTMWLLIKFAMLLTAAYLLWYLWRSDMTEIIGKVTSSWKSFGKELFRGFCVIVLIPVGAIIALFTVVGVIPAIIALIAYAGLLLLSTPVVILVVSSLIMKRRTDLAWYHILLGAAVLTIVALVPFIGWIADSLVCLASLGALAGVLGRRLGRRG